ncbi:MFS transporter [Streptomyces sp. NPDC048639]|uniref:MFS transporter n=1 Tax=Streptomyces sp. NPDC048639 TaxID=3365581 RepID=UPI00371DDC44
MWPTSLSPGAAGIAHDPDGSGRPSRLALAVPATAQFLVVLSTSIVNVALPSLQRDLHLDPVGMSWAVNGYVLAFGALLLLGGRATDLLGHRRMFVGGLALFAVASAAAALAASAEVLIAARIVQGLAAAVLAPAALALVMTLYPSGPRRAFALGVWGAVSGAGGAAGVLLGGLLTDAYGWPAVFWLSVPVSLAAIGGAYAVLPGDRPASGPRHIDLPGAATVTAGLFAVAYALAGGSRNGWTSPATLLMLSAGVLLLLLFVRIQRRSAAPLLPPRILSVGTVGPANVMMAALGAIWIGLFYFLPLYQSQVLGYGPLKTGLTQLPLALTLTLASALAPRLTARLGRRNTLTAGLAAVSVGLVWLGRAPADGTFAADLLGPSLLVGAGLGLAFVRLTTLATDGVAATEAGVAGGLVNTTRQIGGALGLAALTAVAGAASPAPHSTAAAVTAAQHAQGYGAAFLAAAAVAALTSLYAALRSPR